MRRPDRARRWDLLGPGARTFSAWPMRTSAATLADTAWTRSASHRGAARHETPGQTQGDPAARMLHRTIVLARRQPRGAALSGLLRLLLVVASIVGLLLTSSALNLVTEARANDVVRRAVVVVGPVHERTSRYLEYGRAMALAAEAQGMDVVRIFHPNATPSRVKKHANGAHLFIYAGHGNGWPSPYPPFQERTKNGLGLNPASGEATTSNVNYKGADWLRENIRLAPNAVVILSHLSYASGNASSGMPIPTRPVAVERVDNFANGFLAIGARIVWALGWQPGADVIDALHRESATMDGIFMTRYRAGTGPHTGWVGWRPALYYESVRTPFAQIHIDPDPTHGYLRAITGDLAFTTDEWRSGAADTGPPDLDPPVISDVSVTQAAVTVATSDENAPVFTPNGDGLSDTIGVKHTLSEPSFLGVEVVRTGNGNVVRRISKWTPSGRSRTVWDGLRDDGSVAADGTYRIELTPRDRAGNVGEPAAVRVKVLTALKAPRAQPVLFFPNDDDELAQTTRFIARLTKPGTVTWVVRDRSGAIVRTGMEAADLDVGRLAWMWDGLNDAGERLPKGTYQTRVRVARSVGTYGHDVVVHLLPFWLDKPDRQLKRGQTVNLAITSAEPLRGKPTIRIRQPGKTGVWPKVRKVSNTQFTSSFKVRPGGRNGIITVIVEGTDIGRGTQLHRFKGFVLK
jgi:flagellar hook assembly protein FlgD